MLKVSSICTMPVIILTKSMLCFLYLYFHDIDLLGTCTIAPAKRWYPYSIILISPQKHTCGNSLEVPCQGSSSDYTQYRLFWRTKKYSQLSLSWIPRDSLKHFEISICWHIRVERVRKPINWTTIFNKWICNWTPEVRNILYKIMWKRGEIAPEEQFSPLFHIILLPVVIVSC